MLLEHDWPLTFLTDAGGVLTAEPNPLICKVKLDCHPNSATQLEDVLRSRVRLADDEGAVWECVSLFTPAIFFEKLVDLADTSIRTFAPENDQYAPRKERVLSVRAP